MKSEEMHGEDGASCVEEDADETRGDPQPRGGREEDTIHHS